MEATGCQVMKLTVGSSTGVLNSDMSWSELSLWNTSDVDTVCRIDSVRCGSEGTRLCGHSYDSVAVVRVYVTSDSSNEKEALSVNVSL